MWKLQLTLQCGYLLSSTRIKIKIRIVSSAIRRLCTSTNKPNSTYFTLTIWNLERLSNFHGVNLWNPNWLLNQCWVSTWIGGLKLSAPVPFSENQKEPGLAFGTSSRIKPCSIHKLQLTPKIHHLFENSDCRQVQNTRYKINRS
jgi:hypothetical protein